MRVALDHRPRVLTSASRSAHIPPASLSPAAGRVACVASSSGQYDAIHGGNEKNVEDALIALASLYSGVPLVTRDKKLRKRAASLGIDLLWPVEFLETLGFVRPRDLDME
jgi:hypothetical protein